MQKIKPITYLYIITAIILWGFSFIWTNRLLLQDVPIFTFITIRMLLAGTILLIVSLAIKKLQKVKRKDWPLFLLMALFEPFIYFIGESYGMKLTGSPTISAVIIATIPLFTIITGQIFFKEQINRVNILGIVATLPGIFLMVMENSSFSVDYWYGILFLFLAVLGAVGYSTCVKKLTDKYNSFTISTYQFLIAGLYFLPLYLFFDMKKMPLSQIFLNTDILVPLLSLAILCSCLAFVLYISAIKGLGVTKAAVFSTLIPAVSAFGAYMAGQETFTALQILGIVIVIFGVILAQYQKKQRVKN